MATWLEDLLLKHDRIAIAGGPKTGKTSIALKVRDRLVFHADDASNIEDADLWNTARCIVEGRRVLKMLHWGMPFDVVVWLDRPIDFRKTAERQKAAKCIALFRDWHQKNWQARVAIPSPREIFAIIGERH